MTRFAFPESGSFISLNGAEGMICQDRPNLSLSQPHWLCSPPALSLLHSSSTSCCVSQSTSSEIASVNLKCGPPLSAMNSWPSSWNLTVMAAPLGPGPPSPYRATLRIFEFLKIDGEWFAAPPAAPADHRK